MPLGSSAAMTNPGPSRPASVWSSRACAGLIAGNSGGFGGCWARTNVSANASEAVYIRLFFADGFLSAKKHRRPEPARWPTSAYPERLAKLAISLAGQAQADMPCTFAPKNEMANVHAG